MTMSHLKTLRLCLAATIIAAAILGGIGCRKNSPASSTPSEEKQMEPDRVIGLGRIEPELRLLSLASESSGLAVRIPVQAGDRVTAGQVLIELSTGIQRARLSQSEAGARAQTSEIKAAQASLAAARVRLDNARAQMERFKTLVEKDAQTQVAYDDAKAEHDALREDVNRLEAGVAAAEDLFKKYEADKALARAELEQRILRAPADGQVLSLDINPGAFIQSGVALGTFAAESPLTAWCEVDELFAPMVRVGQNAYVRAQGTTELLAKGKVVFAGPALRQKSLFAEAVGELEDRRVREVRVRLESGGSLLLGSRVECVIEVGTGK